MNYSNLNYIKRVITYFPYLVLKREKIMNTSPEKLQKILKTKLGYHTPNLLVSAAFIWISLVKSESKKATPG